MITVADVCRQVEAWYPPSLAEPWDAVGLVLGRPSATVTAMLVTVDVTEATVAEARERGVNMILAHHPLLLGGVESVSATDAKGRIVHDLIESNIALLVAHTNADAAPEGVSDALAALLGIRDLHPLEPVSREALDKFTVFVPEPSAQDVLDAMADAGAGQIGDYDRCAFQLSGEGTFRPLAGADPFVGAVGEIHRMSETRLEMVAARRSRRSVLAAMSAAHPYEEPAFDIVELANASMSFGHGRVGELAKPMTLVEFADVVARALPKTYHGVRVAGDLDKLVCRVAVCGGSGGSFLPLANAVGADVFVTSDLKHHIVSDHVGDGGCAVIDVAHYASEFPWCDAVAARLTTVFTTPTDTVSVQVSETVTDPWSHHLRSES